MLQPPRAEGPAEAADAAPAPATAGAPISCVVHDLFGLSRDVFVANYLGKAPLVAHGSVGAHIRAALPTAERAAVLVPLLGEHPDSVRFARSGDAAATPAPRFTDGSLDAEALWTAYRRGASIVLNNLFKVDAGCKALCEDLFLSLAHRVQANAYLTPASASAFTTHYDTHDVIVVQMSGRKRWHLYQPPPSLPHLPLHHNAGVTPEALEVAGKQEVELSAGSALYLPRGFPHRAGTQEEGSFHITFGLIPITGAELLKTLVDLLEASVLPLREHISPDLFRPGGAMPNVAALIETLSGAADHRASALAVGTLRKQALKAARLTTPALLDLDQGTATRLTWRNDTFGRVDDLGDNSLLVTNGIKATKLSGAEIDVYRRLRAPDGLEWLPSAAPAEVTAVIDRLAALGLIAISPAER